MFFARRWFVSTPMVDEILPFRRVASINTPPNGVQRVLLLDCNAAAVLEFEFAVIDDIFVTTSAILIGSPSVIS